MSIGIYFAPAAMSATQYDECMENNKDLLDGHLDHLRDATYRKYFGID